MASKTKKIIYEGNSIISIEMLPDYPNPVVIKRPSKPHAFRHYALSLEKKYKMTRFLDAVEGGFGHLGYQFSPRLRDIGKRRF
jgi:hypothetical protein